MALSVASGWRWRGEGGVQMGLPAGDLSQGPLVVSGTAGGLGGQQWACREEAQGKRFTSLSFWQRDCWVSPAAAEPAPGAPIPTGRPVLQDRALAGPCPLLGRTACCHICGFRRLLGHERGARGPDQGEPANPLLWGPRPEPALPCWPNLSSTWAKLPSANSRTMRARALLQRRPACDWDCELGHRQPSAIGRQDALAVIEDHRTSYRDR